MSRLFKFLAPIIAITVLIFSGSVGSSRAEEPLGSPNITIGGFIAYNYTFNDDLADDLGGGNNPNERNFNLRGEVDIGIQWAWASARFDLNLPSDGNEEVGIAPASDNDVGIEQVRFDLMPEFGKDLNLTITGGIFNSPISPQHQDPDQKDSITDSLQFGLAPSNLLGIDISGGNEYMSLGAIVANEWHTDTPVSDEQLTFGFHTRFTPTDKFNLSVGGLFTTDAIGDNFVVNGVASTTAFPWANIAIKGTVDENNLGVGTAIRIAKPDHPQCGAALRYDMVWAGAGSDFTGRFVSDHPILLDLSPTPAGDDHDFHLLSLTLFTEPIRHLVLQTEGRATMVEVDAPGGNEETYYGLLAQVIYSF